MKSVFFSKKEQSAIATFLGDLQHARKTRAHLLARCNDDPIQVLDYFRTFVTEEDFQGDEILQKIAKALKCQGYGDKLRFKESTQTKATKIENIVRALPYADILEKRGLIGHAMRFAGAH